MANVSWTHNPPVWTASVDGNAVCNIKGKDIGGCAATWVGDRLWPPPAHLPKATPQPTRFFTDLEDAKQTVEQFLAS